MAEKKISIREFRPYLEKVLKAKRISLLIVGHDPYPTGAIGIPFCKRTWKEFRKRGSGRIILNALGWEIPAEKKSKEGTGKTKFRIIPVSEISPPEFFERQLLKKSGIAFVNLSYSHLGGVKKTAKEKLLRQAWKINKPILEKAKHALICSAEAKRFIERQVKDPELQKKILYAYHPSGRFLANMSVEMYGRFWKPNGLLKVFKMDSAQ